MVCKTCRKEVSDDICWSCGETKENYFYKATHHICLDCLVKESHIKYTEANADDWIECNICGYRASELSSHLKTMHGINAKDYGVSKCKSLKDRMKGENNPAFEHGGRLSPFSKNFKNYKSEDERKATHKKARATIKENGTNPFDRNYYATDEDYTKAQTRDLSWFISKYGEEEGKKRHIAKTEKWMKNFVRCNYSKISQEVFDGIAEIYEGDFYYATYDRPEMIKYENKEYILKLSKSYCRPDFICLNAKKVIEFDGEYWHSESVANPTRESHRDSWIIEQGFDVMHIKEVDYKADKQGTIDKCIKFLTQ